MYRLINILSAVMLLTAFSGCADGFGTQEPTDPNSEGQYEYRLNISIVDEALSRSGQSPYDASLKKHWNYGDQVRLIDEADKKVIRKYTFTIETPPGKNPGDPVTEETASFTYNNTQILNYQSFVGKLEYVNPDRDKKIITGVSSMGIGSFSLSGSNIHKYWVQLSNDNADHIKYTDSIAIKLDHVDLRNTSIVLKRQFSVLKIVLDGFCYPIYGGALVFVSGLKDDNGNDEPIMEVLGRGKGYDWTVKPNITDAFVDVSPTKEPFTGYAKRDEASNHKLVAYIPIKHNLHVDANQRIEVMLMDGWSKDYYIWQSHPLKKQNFPLGHEYTIDFTKTNAAGDPLYEPIQAIYVRSSYYLTTKNIGATRPEDVGDYYSFGHNYKIHKGQPYEYPHYFYYQNDPTKGDILASYIGEDKMFHADEITYTLNSGGADYSGTIKIAGKVYDTLNDFWSNNYTGLSTMPNAFGTLTLPKLLNIWFTNQDSDPQYEPIDQNGNITSEGSANIAGFRLYSSSTGHGVYIPDAGFLQPSDYDPVNNLGKIGEEAVAERSPDDENYVYLVTSSLFFAPASSANDPNKDVQLTAFCFSKNVHNRQKGFKELYQAFPIRPYFEFKNQPFEPRFKYVKGD